MPDSLSIALSGLAAQGTRLSAAASNIANVLTTGRVPDANSPASTVYKPLIVSLTSIQAGGVRAQIYEDPQEFTTVFNPSDPNANSEGLIATPNIDLARELVSLIETKAAFKANLSVIKTQEDMQDSLLNIIT